MTVSELIEALKALPPDTLVVLSSDEEGNSYHELAVVDSVNVAYDARHYTDEDLAPLGAPRCVVLSP